MCVRNYVVNYCTVAPHAKLLGYHIGAVLAAPSHYFARRHNSYLTCNAVQLGCLKLMKQYFSFESGKAFD